MSAEFLRNIKDDFEKYIFDLICASGFQDLPVNPKNLITRCQA
jgi:hypothetical protein